MQRSKADCFFSLFTAFFSKVFLSLTMDDDVADTG